MILRERDGEFLEKNAVFWGELLPIRFLVFGLGAGRAAFDIYGYLAQYINASLSEGAAFFQKIVFGFIARRCGTGR